MKRFKYILFWSLVLHLPFNLSARNATPTDAKDTSLGSIESSRQETIDSLIAVLTGPYEDIKAQSSASVALAQYQDTSHIEVLLSSPLAKDKRASMSYVWALSFYNDDRTRRAIVPYLNDENVFTASLAAKGLARIIDPSVYLPLYRAIISPRNNSANKEAAVALASADDSLSTVLLISALSTENLYSRMVIAQNLGKRDPEVAFDPLVGLLNDEVYGVRMCAANSLGELGDLRATEYLAAKVLENDFGITGHAALAIAELDDTTAVESLVYSLNMDMEHFDLWAICEALRQLTGKDYSESRAEWVNWYESQKGAAGSVR